MIDIVIASNNNSKTPDNNLKLHVIDPYGARQEVWSFRDWVVAMRMDMLFDNPRVTAQEMKDTWLPHINGSGGMMRGIAEDTWVIHKKRPQILVTNRR